MTTILLTQQTPPPQHDMAAKSRAQTSPVPEGSFEREIARNVAEKSPKHKDAPTEQDTKHAAPDPADVDGKTVATDQTETDQAVLSDDSSKDVLRIQADPEIMVLQVIATDQTADAQVLQNPKLHVDQPQISAVSTQDILQHRLALDPQTLAQLPNATTSPDQVADTIAALGQQIGGSAATGVIADPLPNGVAAAPTVNPVQILAQTAVTAEPTVMAQSDLGPIVPQQFTTSVLPRVNNTTALTAAPIALADTDQPSAPLGIIPSLQPTTADPAMTAQASVLPTVQSVILGDTAQLTPQIDLPDTFGAAIQLAQADPDTAALAASNGPTVTIVSQPAVSGATPMATAQPPVTLNTTQPVWTGQFVDHISQNIRDGIEEFEIKLTPDRLGPVTIKVDLRGDLTNVQIVTQTADASRLFNDTQDRLSAMLAQSGLDLGQHSAQTGQGNSGGNAGTRSDQTGDITATTQADAPTEHTRATDPDALIDILA